METQKQLFKEATYQLLNELESAFKDLEKAPWDTDHINRIINALHSITGTSVMVGFSNVPEFLHEIESFFHMVHNRKMAVTKDLVVLGLLASEQVRNMLDGRDENGTGKKKRAAIISSFCELAESGGLKVSGE